MRKVTYLSSIKIWALWVLLPLVALLVWAIYDNGRSEELLGLYPLILLLIGAIVFTIIFFFRLVMVSYAEIRAIGPFSGRDSVMMNAGKTIKLTLMKWGKVRLNVIGCENAVGFDWLKPEERTRDIVLFRSVVYGGNLAIKQVLGFYGVEKADMPDILSLEEYYKKYENISITVGYDDDGNREYTIKMLRTI